MNDTEKKFTFVHQIRVRFADTDAMGIVYHGRYFEWFEAARTEMMRAMGMSYHELTQKGIALPVIEVACRYRIPVRYDDRIRILTVLDEVSKTRIRIRYCILGEQDDSVRAEGNSHHCFTGKHGGPIRAPADVVSFFTRSRPDDRGESDVK